MAETPYTRLRAAIKAFLLRVESPKKVEMWTYPNARLHEGWAMNDLAARVAAADQLGYDVRLRIKNSDLVVEYVERPGKMDLWWLL